MILDAVKSLVNLLSRGVG